MDEKGEVAKENLENIGVGYQNAVALICEEGDQYWSRYTALVYMNTAILVTLAAVLNNNGSALIKFGLPPLGILLCLAWKRVLDRSYSFYKYWMYSARELEEKLPPVKTLSRGRAFADGTDVVFCFKTGEFTLPGNKGPRISTLARGTVYLFIVLYVVIFLDVLFRYWCR
jgi:hypothetical protein